MAVKPARRNLGAIARGVRWIVRGDWRGRLTESERMAERMNVLVVDEDEDDVGMG